MTKDTGNMNEWKRRPRTRGNGTGTVIQRGNVFEARVIVAWKPSEDGSHKIPVWKTKSGFKTRKDAVNFLGVLRDGYVKPDKAPDLNHYWQSYSKSDLLKLGKSKICAYKIAWNRLSKLWYRPVDAITVTQLKETVSGLNYYPAKDVKTLLKHLFRMAGADGWVDRELPEFISLPKLEESEQTPFSADEQKALWKLYESGDKLAAIPLVMIYTGMMPAEAMKLTCEMIDFDHQKIIGVGSKTAVRQRSAVYLSESIIPVLQAVTDGITGKIWRYNKDNFYKVYYEVLERAGVRRLPPYSCRHTTATALAIDKNIAPQTVQKIMRWSSTKMLDRYAHPDVEDAISAANSLTKPE